MGLIPVMSKNNYLLIIPAMLFDFVSTCFSSVGNLAYNATRLSLSNKPFLLNKIMCFSCVHNVPSFLLLFQANNTPSTTFTNETTTPRILRYVSFFFQNYA
jgi:hypothetical protein